jgi:myosin protein heavy chain
MEKSIPQVRAIEGENDFSGKRYVWLKDATTAFVKGWVVDELENDKLLVECDDGTVRDILPKSTERGANNPLATGSRLQ